MDIEGILDGFKDDDNHGDKWDLYDLFKKWAIAEWETIIDTGQIDHGIEHSKRMIDYLNQILNCYSEEELISKLSEKYILLLVISIYTHDIGMQNYFHLSVPDLKKKHLLDFDPFDLDLIREAHSSTINKVYLQLSKKNLDTVPFLIQKMSNFDPEKSERLKSIIYQNSIELSIITSYHNKAHSYNKLDMEITK